MVLRDSSWVIWQGLEGRQGTVTDRGTSSGLLCALDNKKEEEITLCSSRNLRISAALAPPEPPSTFAAFDSVVLALFLIFDPFVSEAFRLSPLSFVFFFVGCVGGKHQVKSFVAIAAPTMEQFESGVSGELYLCPDIGFYRSLGCKQSFFPLSKLCRCARCQSSPQWKHKDYKSRPRQLLTFAQSLIVLIRTPSLPCLFHRAAQSTHIRGTVAHG